MKESIHFYEDVVLFEDELADNGVSKLNIKMVSCSNNESEPRTSTCIACSL